MGQASQAILALEPVTFCYKTDATRKSEYYDQTFEYLSTIGFVQL